MYVELFEQSEDKLERTVWQFYVHDDANELSVKLDYYAEEERKTRRHKFVTKGGYTPIKWSRLHSRDNRIEKPEVPEKIKQVAIAQIMNRISFDE